MNKEKDEMNWLNLSKDIIQDIREGNLLSAKTLLEHLIFLGFESNEYAQMKLDREVALSLIQKEKKIEEEMEGFINSITQSNKIRALQDYVYSLDVQIARHKRSR